MDGGGACLGGTLRFGSDDTVGFAGLTGVPSLDCPFVAIAQRCLANEGPCGRRLRCGFGHNDVFNARSFSEDKPDPLSMKLFNLPRRSV